MLTLVEIKYREENKGEAINQKALRIYLGMQDNKGYIWVCKITKGLAKEATALPTAHYVSGAASYKQPETTGGKGFNF